MQRVFVKKEELEGGTVRITGQDAHHLIRVLRMKEGDEIRVSDGETDHYCILRAVEEGGESVLCEVCYAERGRTELPVRITLYQGLPKADKMEWIIQKAVELGACRIVPTAMERSVVRLTGDKAEKKRSRWQAIAESAAAQSKRMIVPEVAPVMTLAESVRDAAGLQHLLVPYENENGMEGSRRLIGQIRPGESVGIWIGPEGGFSEGEISLLKEAGAQTMSLGSRILRTETAGMALLSVLSFQLDS